MKRRKILDLTKDNCPMIFVKTKIFIEESGKNVNKEILIKGKSNFNSLKKTLSENGYKITPTSIKENLFKIKIS